MTAEGDYGNLVIGFDPAADRVVLLADPLAVQLRAASGRDWQMVPSRSMANGTSPLCPVRESRVWVWCLPG